MKRNGGRTAFQFLGLVVMLSDLKDIGKFDRLHHWHLGALMILVGGLR